LRIVSIACWTARFFRSVKLVGYMVTV
jgi:hypothetical protein